MFLQSADFDFQQPNNEIFFHYLVLLLSKHQMSLVMGLVPDTLGFKSLGHANPL